jgi:hypothetical protein
MRLLAALVVLAGCRPAAEEDLLPPPGFAPPPVRIARAMPLRTDVPLVRRGFFGRETDSEGHSWNWMGARGEVDVPRTPGGAHLRITGWVPREFLRAAPTVRVTLAGRELDRFTVETEVARDILLPDALIGGGPTTLVLETSEVGVPAGDGRTLGLAIRRLDWRPLRP